MRLRSMFLMTILVSTTLVLLGCGGGGSSSSSAPKNSAPTVLYAEDFSTYNVEDKISTGWINISGNPIASTGNNSIPIAGDEKAMQVNANAGGSHVVLEQGLNWTDYTFSVRFKTTHEQQTGVLVRANPAPFEKLEDQKYFQIALIGGNSLRLISKEAGSSTTDETEISYSTNTYYNLKVIVNKENIKIYFENKLMIDRDYPGTTITSGSIAFSSFGDHTYFDDIVVTTP